jgi:hypothetical protein
VTDLFDTLGAVSEERIAAFERMYGLALPGDYREFLKRHNGGRPRPRQFAIPDAHEEGLVDWFYGLDARESLNLEFWLQEYQSDLPPLFMVIGGDPGGNMILLACRGADGSGVYYWDHAHFFDKSSHEENTYLLANSFELFVASLFPEQL